MGSPSAWTFPLLAAYATAVLCCPSEAAEGVHQASGIRLPANIEGRFQRQPLKEAGESCTTAYATRTGHEVQVHIYRAKPAASGPGKLDGDEWSDASPVFKEELDRLIREQSEGLRDAALASRMRVQALAKNGPIGMKATVRGKVDGKIENRELLLFERNGFFVTITARYPPEEWLKTGQTYTDIAHFIGWPSNPSKQPSAPKQP